MPSTFAEIRTEIERLNAQMTALSKRSARLHYGIARERRQDRGWDLQQQIVDLGKQAIAMPAFSKADIRDKGVILRVYLPVAACVSAVEEAGNVTRVGW